MTLHAQYCKYRAMTGHEAFDLTPRELGLRMAALEETRTDYRYDTFRAVTSSIGEFTSGDAVKKQLL